MELGAESQQHTELQFKLLQEQAGQQDDVQQAEELDESPAEKLKILLGHVPAEYTHCR